MRRNKCFTTIFFSCLYMAMLTGCGETSNISIGENNTQNVQEQSDLSVDNQIEDSYYAQVDGLTIAMQASATSALSRISKDYTYFESASCAFEGLDKIYTYDDFEIYTYPQKEQDYILALIFLSDAMQTVEGIAIGASLEDVISVYGDGYTIEGKSYAYEKGGTKLSFLVDNGVVTSIEYRAMME